MTTVSGTSGTTYVAPTTTSTSTTDTSSTAAATSTATPYDGAAAVAQAQALAAQQLASGASGSSGTLIGLSPDILSLLQGGSGSDEIGTLLGTSGGNAFFGAQSLTALYGAAQARAQSSQSTDRVSDIIAANNAVLNANSAATVAAASPSSTSTTTSTDTSA